MASNSKTNNTVLPCTAETSKFVNCNTCNTSYVNWLTIFIENLCLVKVSVNSYAFAVTSFLQM